MTASIFLIYARAANGVIGKDGTLPWHLPADLKRFKKLTMGSDGKGRPMVMGRKTFQSLPGILPGRPHIVLTRRDSWDSEGAEQAQSIEQAVALAQAHHDEIAVIGGAAIFDVFMSRANRIELTQIHADYDGDVFMPILGADWEIIAREDHAAEGDKPAFSFLTYQRVAPETPV